jgi:copper transport protein
MSFPRPFRILGAAVVTLGAMAAWAPPAWAHANLLSTDPEYGANLDAAPARVVVRYDLPVEVSGAQVKLQRGAQPVRAGRPGYASADHKDVAVPLPKLEPGRYLLAWFLFGSDGDVMGGEVRFTVAGAVAPATGAEASAGPGAVPPRARARAFAPLSQAQDAARLVGVAGLSLVLGGVIFTAAVWPAGLEVRRTRLLLAASLVAAFAGNAAALGLKGAAVSGRSALGLFSPGALTALNGTHVGRVLVARLAILAVGVAFLAYLLKAPHRALHSDHWAFGSAACALGVLVTHGMLSHASRRGVIGLTADAVHLGAVAVWLGGLAVLAVVVLPRRRSGELSAIVPRWSRLAFDAMTTAVVAGAVLFVVVGPRWSGLWRAPYGRFLLVKLVLVAVLLAAASRAREFAVERLPTITDTAALQPLVAAVTAELCIAASILTATAVLVGRPPPT